MKELTNIINDPEDNINELTFYFEHLLSEDITIEEQENILRKINERGINEFFLSSLSNVLLDCSFSLHVEKTNKTRRKANVFVKKTFIIKIIMS